MMISLDTECGGLDHFHGTQAYLITIAHQDGTQQFWEWPVSPLTRDVIVPPDDLEEIRGIVDVAELVVGHNYKYDSQALAKLGIETDWSKVRDTLLAAHLLASNRPHNLTDVAIQYLGHDIEPLEKKLETAVQACRRYCRSHFKDWRIAKEGLPDMPSAGGKCWKADGWLPRAVYKAAPQLRKEHPEYQTVLSEYANADSAVTLALWPVMEREIKRRGLMAIYQERLKILPVIYRMEQTGVTANRRNLEHLREEYERESERSGRVCVNIATGYGYELVLPKNGRSKNLEEFCFGVPAEDDHPLFPSKENKYLDLPVVVRTETGKPSMNKEAMATYVTTLPNNSKQLLFVKAMMRKRKRDTALGFLESYEKFWLPLPPDECKVCDGTGRNVMSPCSCSLRRDWFVLHPSINLTGTDTLRTSSSNPNSQQISTQELEDEGGGESYSLRYCFGPAPGREWWSLDYRGIEQRIPAYESGEEKMIELFEKPDEPPYYGSYHLLNASLTFPDEFWPLAEMEGVFKKKYFQLYKRIKNFGFAKLYGCGEAKGDLTAGKRGSYRAVEQGLPKIAALNKRWIDYANKHGYVETIPDRTVDPKRGYPILCSRTERGSIPPTVPLNYHVQGTACWAALKGLVRCQAQLDEWRGRDGFDGRIVLYVHDELVFDFPRSKMHPRESPTARGNKFRTQGDNLWRIKRIQDLMMMSGDDLGVPLTTGLEYHAESWAKGESF